ncbi:MAG: ATP-binding cassette domain-containing protein, partial [Rhizobiaceae bacterium]|nr:ATP-binding cassette domain-containing protein [Rhizobiaceae bacterium]
MAAAPEKARDGRRRSLRPLRRLTPYVLRYRAMVAGAVVFLVLAAATTLTLPLAVRRMIDNGFNAENSALIGNYFAMLVVIALVLAGASAARYYFVITLGERVIADLRRDVFAHVTRLSADFFDRAQSGEIVSRLAADTTQVKAAVGATVSQALRNAIMGTGAVAMMVVTSPKLSAMVIVAIPFVVLPLIAFGRSVQRKSRMAQDTLADATAYASEQIGAIRTVQAFTSEGPASAHFASSVEFAYEAARSSVKARALLTFVAIFIIFASVVAVLWAGSRDVLAGTMSAGTLSQFLIYAVIAAGALGAMSEVWGELSQAAGAAERISELLSEVPTIAAPTRPTALPLPARGAVAFDKVSFAYPTAPGRLVLDRLDLSVAAGETVAIVGPSGSGKSTIFSLILRYYDPTSGAVRVDGVDIRETEPQDLRRRIAV